MKCWAQYAASASTGEIIPISPVQAPVVEPVDVFRDGDLDVPDRGPAAFRAHRGVADAFGLEQRVERLGHRVDALNAPVIPPTGNTPTTIEINPAVVLAVTRLGKQVVDLEDLSGSYGNLQVLDDVTWRIALGEHTGILGTNGPANPQ